MTDFQDSSWTIYRLPRSHHHCHLWNFEWPSVKPAALHTEVTNFLQAMNDGKAPHLILTGRPGIGKSHLGVGVYRVGATVVGTELATWVNVPNFCESVKRSYTGDMDPWSDFDAAKRLVVLDDMFGRDLTPHEKDQIVTRLIDTSYTNGAAVLVTMNPDVKELAARLPAHEVSRIMAGATIIPMTTTKDWRA